MTGKTKELPTSYFDPTAQAARATIAKDVGGVNPVTGLGPSGEIPQAYMDLFSKSLAPILAQAKESAGDLTGSGLGNVIGSTAGRSLSDFLLGILNQTAGRASGLYSQLAQPLGQQVAYQPGFLDYWFQGLQAAAPIAAKAAA